MTWGHYVLGLRHLVRADARDTLRIHRAVTAANAAKPEDRERWSDLYTMLAGWRGR